MKRILPSLMILCLLLAGCQEQPMPPSTTAETTSTPTKATQPATVETTQPTTIPSATETTVPIDTEPEHSPLYIPGIPVEDVILYFNEVCLNAEFVNSGDPSFLQRWEDPIRYFVFGDYTEEDWLTLSVFTQWLNTIEGFPGISEADDPDSANLRIHFCTESEFIDLMGSNFYGCDGGVTFWYLQNEIYDAIICYRTDLGQQLRNSVILEEIYNGLGPVQDTGLREDSIIYSGFSQPQGLTPVDELLLKLLYHPQMQCGMDADTCEAVIRQLYY